MTLTAALARSPVVQLGDRTFNFEPGLQVALDSAALTSENWMPVLPLKEKIAEDWTGWLSRQVDCGSRKLANQAILGAIEDFERRSRPDPISVEEYATRKQKLLAELRDIATRNLDPGHLPDAIAWSQRIDELLALEARNPFKKTPKNPLP